MTLSKSAKNHEKIKKCSYSGKPIANREVILVEYAIDYVRKMGYLVTNFKVK